MSTTDTALLLYLGVAMLCFAAGLGVLYSICSEWLSSDCNTKGEFFTTGVPYGLVFVALIDSSKKLWFLNHRSAILLGIRVCCLDFYGSWLKQVC